jgi:NADPH:quinone reductase-like Zn-dependent oxidoreductase
MKAVVVHKYGNPEVLRYEDYPDPVAKTGEVLVRISGTSVNPIDIKRRSGALKEFFPIRFPGVLGFDVAGTIESLGPDVQGWKVGDKVAALGDQSYAQICAVNVSVLAKVPDGMNLAEAAVLPVVATTGFQLISEGIGLTAGQTALVTGAVGNVGRCAVFAAKDRGARVIAAVREKQLDDASSLGADSVVATDDDSAMEKLPPLDAVADTVAGTTGEILIRKIKSSGIFASTLGPPSNAKDFPSVKTVTIEARPNPTTLRFMCEAVHSGRFSIPISRQFPLKDAAAAHANVEGGLGGKVLLLP